MVEGSAGGEEQGATWEKPKREVRAEVPGGARLVAEKPVGEQRLGCTQRKVVKVPSGAEFKDEFVSESPVQHTQHSRHNGKLYGKVMESVDQEGISAPSLS